jgi:hypothetical protein
MAENLLFGPAHWSRSGECLYLPIIGTSTYFQAGPLRQDHPVHACDELVDGKAPALTLIAQAFPELQHLAWDPALHGSFPSIEVHGHANGLEVRLLDVAGKAGGGTQQEQAAHKGASLLRLSAALETTFKKAELKAGKT